MLALTDTGGYDKVHVACRGVIRSGGIHIVVSRIVFPMQLGFPSDAPCIALIWKLLLLAFSDKHSGNLKLIVRL